MDLKWDIKDVVCSKCDGTSYHCYGCDILKKIEILLDKHKIKKEENN